MTTRRHSSSDSSGRQVRSVAKLGMIAVATADSAAITESAGRRLLGTIAAVVARQINGCCLVSVSARNQPAPVTVLVQHPRHPPVHLAAPRGPVPPSVLGAISWPSRDRFASGDLGEVLTQVPAHLAAQFVQRRRGALALLPVGLQGAPSGIMLAYRPLGSYSRFERAFMRAVRGQTSVALQLHQTLQRADEALAAREAFLKLASHELGGPLSTASLLTSALELAADGSDPPVGQHMRTSIHMVKHQLERALALLRQLANVVRRAQHIPELQPEDLDLGELVASVLSAMRVHDPRSSILSLHVPEQRLFGHWDRGQIEQVVYNLLANALKFGEGNPVQVALSAVAGGVVLRVEDRGIGIAPEDQERIFECFARAVPSRQYPGLGLGLWLVREIVTAHGGRVTVHSRPGEGARFEVWLPSAGGADPSP